MDTNLVGLISAASAQSIQQIADESGRAARRLADAHGTLLLGVQGAVVQALTLPDAVAGLNTASAAPVPREQIVPGFYATPTAKPAGA